MPVHLNRPPSFYLYRNQNNEPEYRWPKTVTGVMWCKTLQTACGLWQPATIRLRFNIKTFNTINHQPRQTRNKRPTKQLDEKIDLMKPIIRTSAWLYIMTLMQIKHICVKYFKNALRVLPLFRFDIFALSLWMWGNLLVVQNVRGNVREGVMDRTHLGFLKRRVFKQVLKRLLRCFEL